MNCEKVDELLDAFHDGATSAAVQTRIRQHIAGCLSCAAAFDRLEALRHLLRKDIAPSLSAAFDRKLMQAFLDKHPAPAKSLMWWRWLFAGSISIPKPVFAAVLIAVALAFITANLIGRSSTAVTNAVDTALTAPPAASSQSSPPLTKTVEQTKIVEVPVIKERVVTKTIYIERENVDANKTSKKSSGFNLTQTTAVNKKSNDAPKLAAPNLPMSGSIAENGYFTQTDLTDFKPAAEPNIRIIKKEKENEK